MAKYIRVRDESSGREFDHPEGAYLGGLTVIKDYPENLTDEPRPAKDRAELKRITNTKADKAADNKE